MRQPSNEDVKAAVWEAAGDFGAFQLLVDLLYTKYFSDNHFC